MSSSASKSMHSDVRMLLPWYANSTLSEVECEKVRLHLGSCVECREELSSCADIMESVRQQEATPILPATTAAQVLDRSQQHVAGRSGRSRQLMWGLAAAAGLVAVVIMSGATLLAPSASNNQRFETATAVATVESMGYVLELQFVDGLSNDDRLAIIDELGGKDAMMAAEYTFFRIVLNLPPKSLDELERYASAIESRSEIRSAEFVALQLPMR